MALRAAIMAISAFMRLQKDGVLSISVTDDGCGMNQDMVDWINSPAPAKRDGHLGLYNVIPDFEDLLWRRIWHACRGGGRRNYRDAAPAIQEGRGT